MTGQQQPPPRHARVNVAPLRSGTTTSIEERTTIWVRGGEVLGVRLLDGPSEVVVEVSRGEQGFEIRGTANGRWSGECRRCLATIEGEVEAEIDDVFDPFEHRAATGRIVAGAKWAQGAERRTRRGRSHSTTESKIDSGAAGAGDASVEDEPVVTLDGEVLDFTGLVRESLLFALPLAPVCSTECEGPSPDAYPIGQSSGAPTELPDGHGGFVDPEWEDRSFPVDDEDDVSSMHVAASESDLVRPAARGSDPTSANAPEPLHRERSAEPDGVTGRPDPRWAALSAFIPEAPAVDVDVDVDVDRGGVDRGDGIEGSDGTDDTGGTEGPAGGRSAEPSSDPAPRG